MCIFIFLILVTAKKKWMDPFPAESTEAQEGFKFISRDTEPGSVMLMSPKILFYLVHLIPQSEKYTKNNPLND